MTSTITQSATTASHLLLLNSDSIIFIYSISATPELLYQTNVLRHHSVKAYSLGLSFFIIDGQTSEIFQIDTDRSIQLQSMTHLFFSCRSLFSTIMTSILVLCILSDDHSILATWHVQQKTIRFSPVLLDTDIEIKEICALPRNLVFYDNSQRAHLWAVDSEQIIVTLDQAFFEMNNNYRTLIERTGNKWYFYCTKKEETLPRINLDMSCDALCFTEDGTYLFGVSQKESSLFMYRVDNGQILEQLFIENLLPQIQVVKDYLILNSNHELLLMCIIDNEASSLKR